MTSVQLRTVITALERFVAEIVRKVVLDIVANLKRAPSEGGTPVDTGWARANWVPNIGTSFKGTVGTREQAESGVIPTGVAAAAIASVLTYRFGQGKVFVTNNVPYIVRLNEGSSQQAPAGFVQANIQKAVLIDLVRSVRRP